MFPYLNQQDRIHDKTEVFVHGQSSMENIFVNLLVKESNFFHTIDHQMLCNNLLQFFHSNNKNTALTNQRINQISSEKMFPY